MGSGWQYFVVNCKLPECAVKNYLFPKLFVWKECSEFDNFKKIAAKILDPVILRRQEAEKGTIQRSSDNPQLRTYDIEMLKEMAFHTVHMNGSRRSKLLLFEKLKQSAEELNDYLKKEYHLE